MNKDARDQEELLNVAEGRQAHSLTADPRPAQTTARRISLDEEQVERPILKRPSPPLNPTGLSKQVLDMTLRLYGPDSLEYILLTQGTDVKVTFTDAAPFVSIVGNYRGNTVTVGS